MLLAVCLVFLVLAMLMGFFFGLGMLIFKLLYTLCIGLPIAICLVVLGMVFCITVIGIPIGSVLFRVAGFVLVPYR